MLTLETGVNQLLMVGAIYAARLKKLDITTIGDLLFHLPFRYEDYSTHSKIVNLTPGRKVSISGTVISFKNIYTKHGKRLQKGKIADETAELEIIWYNQPYLKNIIRTGAKLALSGEARWFGHKLTLESPEYEIIKPGQIPIHTGRLVPIYPETEGLSSKWLRSRINAILNKLSPQIPEILPQSIIEKFNLMGRREAIYLIHFPQNLTQAETAKRRLAFDELVTLQLAAETRKKEFGQKTVGFEFGVEKYKGEIGKFIENLPFELTRAQNKALSEILSDFDKNVPMNRLLEGDVGSGKTVVATISMYLTYLNGLKSALLAPTEILAQQHYQTVTDLLSPLGIKVGLITSSTKNKLVPKGQLSKKFEILIGTHALLSEKIKIEKLGLVVIDEQQRFGVEQRAVLREKGDNPHVLILTATPIPRTIALTLYADLSLSVIDEMPKGRQQIKTWVVPSEKREKAYVWIEKQVRESNHKKQAFIICPFIEEPARIATPARQLDSSLSGGQSVAGGSESLATVKAATVEYERLKTEVFPNLRLGLLHGKMAASKKEKVMSDLGKKRLDILVSTPVVEVGIDIPTATIMMIEAADRFGLSQLHQLRGRVGRSDMSSFCLLFTQSENPQTLNRLKILETVFSGPKLAEYDLKLRGAGQIFGTAQHGHFGLKVADLTDLVLIEESKEAASLLLTYDERLERLPLLKAEVQKYTIEKIAPD